ncbi:MAG: hypothetical protein H0Z29_11965 [Candidatus Marinimicrobia bacterium]|nr:hypothetical protein [Candidatus Neomarinimicrobiota bacterium]
MPKRIKDTYQKYLWIFISVNILIFWSIFIYGTVNFDKINLNLYKFISIKSFIFFLSPIITIVLNGIIPNSIKEVLVFWKVKNRLPGYRAFSHFAIKDPRVNIESLKDKVGEFPKEPKKQNRVWYSLCQQYRDDEIVWGSHRDFLITRDFTSLSFLFLLVFGTTLLLFNNSNYVFAYLGYLIIQYLSLSLAARNYGNRFVCNVLAKASQVNNR